MNETKQDRGSILRGALLPAAAVGTGIFAGSILGANLSKAIVNTAGMKQFLRNATQEEKARFFRRLKLATGAVGGASGAATSGISYAMLQQELEKRKKAKEREKTAMYAAFFDELRRL